MKDNPSGEIVRLPLLPLAIFESTSAQTASTEAVQRFLFILSEIFSAEAEVFLKPLRLPEGSGQAAIMRACRIAGKKTPYECRSGVRLI